MTLKELEGRVRDLELKVARVDEQLMMARWLGPIVVGVAAIVVSILVR